MLRTSRRRVFVLKNEFVERELRVVNGVVSTARLRNRLTGREYRVDSREFVLRVNTSETLTNRDFTVEKATAAPSGRSISFVLRGRDVDIKILLRFEVGATDFYMRKSLKLEAGECLVNEIHVESLALRGAHRYRFGGFGQPLFMDDELFMGLEYPAGYNTLRKGGEIVLKHYPGRRGRIESKKAVLGVCPNTVNNRVRDWFLKYLDRNRARPVRGFFHAYWMLRMPFLPDGYRGKGLRLFKEMTYWAFDQSRDLYARHGIPVHAICNVANQAWVVPQSVMGEKPETEQFLPLRQIRREARQKIGAQMGFHVNTAGGRKSLDHAWFRKHFDMIEDRYYCLADPRVKRELKKNLLHLLTKYDAAWFYFDWLWWKTSWECSKPDHRGHLVGVKYSREAITDSFIEIATALRKANPDVVLTDIQCELSPWLVLHAESLWDVVGEGHVFTHQQADSCMRNWSRRYMVYPLNSIDHAHEMLPDVTPRGKRRSVWNRIELEHVLWSHLRGAQFQAIFFPKHLTPKGREDFAMALKWANAHADILLGNGACILGDTNKDQVHGYSHFTPENVGIIGIRNPALWSKERVKLTLDEHALFHKRDGVEHSARIVFPYREALPRRYKYGDVLELEVQGGQMLVLEIEPVAGAGLSAQAREVAGQANAGVVVKQARLSRRGRGKRSGNVRGGFALTVPKGVKVRVCLCLDLYERQAGATALEGKETEEWDEAMAERDGLAQACGQSDLRVTSGGSVREVLKLVKNFRKRVIRMGMHPRKDTILYSRATFSAPVSSGTTDYALSWLWPKAQVHAWLEVEKRVARRGSVPCELPDVWGNKRIETVTLSSYAS